jgi:hypothetical protein
METPKHFLQIQNTETMKMEEKLCKSKGGLLTCTLAKKIKIKHTDLVERRNF